MPVIAPLFVSIPDAARALCLGTTKTKELIASGQLRSVKVDRRRLIPVEALEELARSLQKSAA